MAKVKKRSDGLYQKQITIGRNADGSYKRKTVYGKTQKELDEKIGELIHQLSIGIRIDDDSTFNEVADIWIKNYRVINNTSWAQTQERITKRHLIPYLGNIKVKQLTKFDLQSLMNMMRDGEAMDALPKHIIPHDKESYERLLSCCDEMAKRMGGHIRGIVSYEKWDANIYLVLPFIEFTSAEDRALLMEMALRASSITFEPTAEGKVKMHLFFYYFEDEGDKDEVLKAEIEKDPRLMELLMPCFARRGLSWLAVLSYGQRQGNTPLTDEQQTALQTKAQGVPT